MEYLLINSHEKLCQILKKEKPAGVRAPPAQQNKK